MHLHYAEIVQVIEEDGISFGKIRVGRSMKKVPLSLLTEPECGDKVLVCDGVAISKVEEMGNGKENDVLSDPRETA